MQERIVVITGASSGIGEAAAEIFAAHGDHVILLSRRSSVLRNLCHRIRKGGGSCEYHRCDVRRETQVRGVSRRVLRKHGRVDVLINNAGITVFRSIRDTTVKEFDDIVDTNLRGVFLITKAFLPSLLGRRAGMVINVISHTAKNVYTGSGAYAASKAGAEALMNVLRAEVRESGVRVVNVYPGAVLTSIWHARHRKAYAHRMLRPADIAATLQFLSTQPASVVTEEIVIRPRGGDLKV